MLPTFKIHGFYDSSEQAYGACLYVRSTDSNNKTSCELLCSTSTVAPLKQLTIPRLELCAATLLAKLYKKAIRALNITVNESHLWIDSSIAPPLDTGSTKQMKNFCRQQSCFNTRKNSFSHLETCTNSIQSC